MKTLRGDGLTGWIATVLCAVAILTAGISTGRADQANPESRTWKTKDGKHSVEAVLVSHSIADVTLKLTNGTEKTIKLILMSTTDAEYLRQFPNLKGDADAKNLPWVRVQAKTKSREKSGTSRSLLEIRSKTMDITIANRDKRDLELNVLYGFIVEDLNGKSRFARRTTLDDLSLQGVRVRNV